MSKKTNLLLNLTKKQKEKLKGILDSKIIGCALATHAETHSTGERAVEYSKKASDGMDRYNDILNALHVLGVTIEGHEQKSER